MTAVWCRVYNGGPYWNRICYDREFDNGSTIKFGPSFQNLFNSFFSIVRPISTMKLNWKMSQICIDSS